MTASSASSTATYAGQELEIFALASNWKRYLRAQIAPFLGSSVLEVGAGIGATTGALCDGTSSRWMCLDPDAALLRTLREQSLPRCCEVFHGVLADLPTGERFDTILYIDVLEHIEDDRGELARAAAHLRSGGTLVVLAPAHNWLYSPFDRAIGHHRRYNSTSLAEVAPPGLRLEKARYLDAAGLFLSLTNRLLLRQALPSRSQILFWDRVAVPMSRTLDRFLAWRVGKSILVIWRA